jgi:prepilin-type N-terminal cleavage/methylation domain-containing protein
MTTRRRSCRRGFTLLEFAISIAMILVLLAILLPALSAGRVASRRSVCADHLRELGEGIVQTVEDLGAFPGLYSEAGWRWGGFRFSRAMEQPYLDYERPFNPHLVLMRPPARLLELFQCPADSGIRGDVDTSGTGPRTVFEAYGTSYRANDRLFDARLAGVSETARPLHLDEIAMAPSKLVVMGDPVWYEVYEQTGRHADWHEQPGVGNLLLLDGSVRFQAVRRKGKHGPAVLEPVWTPAPPPPIVDQTAARPPR